MLKKKKRPLHNHASHLKRPIKFLNHPIQPGLLAAIPTGLREQESPWFFTQHSPGPGNPSVREGVGHVPSVLPCALNGFLSRN